jgi:hypothetical protein
VLVVPFWLVAVLAVLYIGVIGPLDFFVLRRIRRHTAWAWWTFSLVVVLFCALAYALASYWKGSQLGINQVDLVDIDLASGWTRGTTWAHIYSPRSDTFNLALQPEWPPQNDMAVSGTALTWQGLPGRGFGGMDSGVMSVSQAEAYTIQGERTSTDGRRLRMSRLPIATWSTRSLSGQWWSRGPGDETAHLAALPDGQLRGTFRNPLPVVLHDCLLIHAGHEGWAYRVGDLGPFATKRVEDLKLRDLSLLEDVLVRRKLNREAMKNVTTPWDARNVDVARILEMIMFHRAAGGRSYTKLLHRYQPSMDLSDQLSVGRAILLGHCRQSRSTIERDGDALTKGGRMHGTFYRIVFPVNL